MKVGAAMGFKYPTSVKYGIIEARTWLEKDYPAEDAEEAFKMLMDDLEPALRSAIERALKGFLDVHKELKK